MNIALLNTRITIQKSSMTVDGIGNHIASWEDFYSCHATVSSESPSEDTAAGTVVDNTKADFTVRWCRAVSEVTADQFRVVYAGELYNILGIDHMNFKKKSVKLKCQKVRR